MTAIGDSVMLSAAQELAAVTPSIYIDAAVGRQLSAAIVLLRQLDADGKLGGIVLITWATGSFTDAQFDQIMTITGAARRVVFGNLKELSAWEATNNAAIAGGVARYAKTPCSSIGTRPARAGRNCPGATSSIFGLRAPPSTQR